MSQQDYWVLKLSIWYFNLLKQCRIFLFKFNIADNISIINNNKYTK